MVFFNYGFIFLAGAAFGTAMAHRGQHHRHGHCWRRHWGHHGGDQGRWHEPEHAQASYGGDEYHQQDRRGAYYYDRPADDTVDRDTETEEREYRRLSVKKNHKSAAAATATSDY